MHPHKIQNIVDRIDALDGVQLDTELLARVSDFSGVTLNLHVPTFKHYESSEITPCTHASWPSVSITGSECKLQCDHCKARILEPMHAAPTPEKLWLLVQELVGAGARGMLLTGGSNHHNEVEYAPFYQTLRRIKDHYPWFVITVHTGLVDSAAARELERAGVDVAMLDIIGAQDTIRQVYHLKREVDDFEQSLAALVATRMKVVPHIVIGLHYGYMLGEWRALEIVSRHLPDALVMVVAMPFYASEQRPYRVPDMHQVGRLFVEARGLLPDLDLFLGCARPGGEVRQHLDAYAVLAGFRGIAHPADGIVEFARCCGREARVVSSCCSVNLADQSLGLQVQHAACKEAGSARPPVLPVQVVQS